MKNMRHLSQVTILWFLASASLVTCTSISSLFNVNSETQLCAPTEFYCSEKCISSSKRCDGVSDCPDGADESNCESIKCLAPDYYKCANNKCISSLFVCDKENDCGDDSDEAHCHNRAPTKPCTSGEFKCSNGACIPSVWHCDGHVDCDDGSDEDMEKCREKVLCTEGFLCKNLHCVSNFWRCDKKDDCGDGSDEIDCELRIIDPDQCLQANRNFLCHDRKKCLNVDNVCNGASDCLDESDEGGICNNTIALEKDCKEANCSGVYECLRKPHGVMCVCPKGTNSINGTCIDINECEEFGMCDQYCLNSYGTNVCTCDPDYELKDNHTCKIRGEEPVLVYSSLRQIKSLNLATNKNIVLVDKLQHATGVAVDGENLYWTIIYDGSQALVRSNKNEDRRPEIIVTSGLGTPENLAIDSMTHNLYFTDAKKKHIGVCSSDGTTCTVLHNKDIDKPRAIAVSPSDGYMYWSDWGEKPMIARSGMDGSQPAPFVTHDIHWPNGIHVDYLGKRIYWVDAKMQIIESIKLDATDRRTVVTESVDHPFSVIVFEDKLYWSDWSGKEIKVCNKFTGRDCRSVVREAKTRIYGMQIYHPSLFKANAHNPCTDAKCSDICLLAPKKNGNHKGYTCACPDDKLLASDGRFCIDMGFPATLIVGTSTGLLQVEHEHLGRQKTIEIPLKNKIPRISAITYNSLTGAIIIYDSKSKKISMYDVFKMKLLDLVTSELGVIHSLKFDNYGNNLYWCDWGRGTLDVLSLTTKTRTVLLSEVDGYIPIAVALVPDQGYMFVAMKSESHLHIDRIHMDGYVKSHEHIVEMGLMGEEMVLHFDMTARRLYFTDFRNGIIESVNQDGLDRRIIKNAGSVYDLVTLGDELFWVSRGLKHLYWMDKNDGEQSSRMFEIDVDNWKLDSKLCLAAMKGTDKNIQHPCQKNNGGCSHVCLVSGKGKTCGCPLGMFLSENGQNCTALKQCSVDEFRCSTGECILSRFRCDGIVSCPHGDDEDVVMCQHFTPNMCPKTQFLCHDRSKCLDKKLLCNKVKDCADGSDEEECGLKHKCDPESEFHCSTGQCIPLGFLCDGHPDCGNGEDEFNCESRTCHHMEFRCKSGTCISAGWECDGQPDCADGSDEHSTCHLKKCKADQYRCSNGRCISHKFTCNGEDDCDDNSDEDGCPPVYIGNSKSKPTKHCNEKYEFECDNIHGRCVPIESRCNGTSECKKFEDELNCGCQTEDSFECDNKRCISKAWMCDKFDDCGDQSDETAKACELSVHRTAIYEEGCEGYLCKSRECIPFYRACDKKIDCKDGSDEGSLCGMACQNSNCTHKCLETPKGGQCVCQYGYKLSSDGVSCKDINECENRNTCAQFCTNSDGSYECSCLNTDFMLRPDKRSCKALGPSMDLVYSVGNEVRSVSGDLKEIEQLFESPGVKISGLDIDTRKQLIYWTSDEAGILVAMNMKAEHKVYMKDLVHPSLVRVDWITENVYFVENFHDIVICNLNSKRCAIIYSANVHWRISALAIDPLTGYMFWAECKWFMWNSPSSVIKRSDCSGNNIKTVVEKGLLEITDITLDSIQQKIYWVDMPVQSIHSANYDGNDGKIVYHARNGGPRSLSLFEDKLYWTSDATGYSIYKCKIFATTNVECDTVPVQVHEPIGIFMISHASKQINETNMCNHVKCDFICVSAHKHPMCVCPDGSQVEPYASCEDAGHRKSPTFANIGKGSNVSLYAALLISLLVGLGIFYYYIYHYRTKPFISIPRFHFHNPLSTVNEIDTRGVNIQHTQLEPGRHDYENPMNEESFKDVPGDVVLHYTDARSVDSGSESRHTSLSIADYKEDQKKKLIVF
ncbi:vitellogenin receptor [Adelges cooleyi]|uniref:vitellogenin receptor n=1 Tax=Adelges cooleyi TaxID=133065 RepID=UPI00217F67EA|nr:vitellogenin receptor [Adelges cooleyi]